jgi:peptidoglycan/LPS O-acetylase OafA/YrhL
VSSPVQLLTVANFPVGASETLIGPAKPPTLHRFPHLPQLDGFRGVAILLVLVTHTLETSNVPSKWMIAIGPLGALGVLLFFILSGFLITSLLVAERRETFGIDLKKFYVRRALRLCPALFIFLGTVFVLVQLHQIAYVSNGEFLACLLYARNFYGHSMVLGHIWSLSLEEQFYLCCPFILRALPINWSFRVAATVACLIAAIRAIAIHFDLFHPGEPVYYTRPYFRFDSILVGVCLALALVRWPTLLDRARFVLRRLPVGLLWFPLVLWSMFGARYSHSFYQSIQLVLATILLNQLVVGHGRWSQVIFRNSVLRYLGKISYGLYLWQQLFLLARPASWGTWPTFPVWLLAPLILAALSYRFLESPALRLKRRFEYTPHRALNLSVSPVAYANPRSV